MYEIFHDFWINFIILILFAVVALKLIFDKYSQRLIIKKKE